MAKGGTTFDTKNLYAINKVIKAKNIANKLQQIRMKKDTSSIAIYLQKDQ